jgi:hypothetical protein
MDGSLAIIQQSTFSKPCPLIRRNGIDHAVKYILTNGSSIDFNATLATFQTAFKAPPAGRAGTWVLPYPVTQDNVPVLLPEIGSPITDRVVIAVLFQKIYFIEVIAIPVKGRVVQVTIMSASKSPFSA